MAAATASSLHFLSLPSKTPLSTTKSSTPTSLFFFNPSLKPLPKLFSSHNKLFESSPISSRFARNVAVSNDYGVDEGLSSDGDGEEQRQQNFSPDLKLFVGNLPFSVDSAALAELFEQAGNVEMVEVIYDKVTGRSRGFGFVTMSSVEEVRAAEQQFNGYEFEGRQMRVNSGPAPPKRDDFGSPRTGGGFGSGGGFGGGGGGGGGRNFNNANRVYVGNLSWSVDNASLESLFAEQGNVLEAKVVYDRDSGRSRGFGFVTFSSSEEVESAVEQLNGADLDGRNIRVSVAEAPPPRRQF